MALDIRQGDVIRLTSTSEVVAVVDVDRVRLRDTVDGLTYTADLGGSTRVEMVKRVPRRKPQRQDFEVGQVVTADTLRQVMWRRGTMICPKHHPELASVLHGDGRWHALNGEAWDFNTAEGKFKLLYLPD